LNNKSKKKSNGENLFNGNYYSSQNNHPNLNSNSGGKILPRKSNMNNNTKKANANKEFNGSKFNFINKYFNKNSSKEKNNKSDYQNTLFSPYRGKNNKNL